MAAQILVPFDGSKHALKALHIASDLACKYKCGVRVLAVVAPGAKPAEDAREKALSLVASAQDKLAKWGVHPVEVEVEHGQIAETILLVAQRLKVKIIVMGCRGVPDLEPPSAETGPLHGDQQFGSVSQKVFHLADCTCISVK